MEGIYVALALCSAFLHAAWNAAVKGRPNATHAMTAQMVLAAIYMVPLLLYAGMPSRAAVPWMIASAAINTVAVTALLRGYGEAGFGLVYPMARALSVLLVAPGAALLFGERLGWAALGGIALISVALALLAAGRSSSSNIRVIAWFWIALAGLSTAVNVLIDVQGVRASGNAIAYGCCASLINAVVMAFRQRHAALSGADLRRETLAMAPVAIASVISYLLILYVYTKAPAAPAAALRDTSALFAVVLAVIWLKERLAGRQLVAIALAALAVPLLRLG